MGTLLLYHTEKDKAAKVRSALALTGVRVLEPGPGQELWPIGMLAEGKIPAPSQAQSGPVSTPGAALPAGPASAPGTASPAGAASAAGPVPAPLPMPVREPVCVIAVESESMFDHVLAVLRSSGLQGILKAVVTPVNRSWNVRQLYGELCAERRAVEQQQRKKSQS